MQRTEPGRSPGAVAADASLEPYLEAWNDLESRGESSVVDVLAECVEVHERLRSEVGLTAEAPDEWQERADLLLEYRRRIDSEILTPLAQAYEQRSPTALVEDAVRRASERSEELSRALPEQMDAPWQDDALDAAPSDSLGRRMGKVLARLVSAARRPGVERSLPLRVVTLRHLYAVVAPGQDAIAADALVLWAGWSRRLELIWVEWGRAALPALVRAELPGDEREDVDELWNAIRTAAQALQTGLASLLAEDPLSEIAAAARVRLDNARGSLAADLAVAGSFLLDPASPPPRPPPLPRVSHVAPALREWDEGVAARLRLHLSLLSILSGATAVQRRMVWRFRDRCLSRVPVFTEVAGRLEALAADFDGSSTASFETRLDRLDAATEAALEPALDAIPETFVVDSAVREISDSTIEALSAMIRQAPAALELHAASSRVPVAGRKADTRTLPLQELARQSFDALRVERIRSSTSSLIEALDQARTSVSEVGEVYSFARDEATRELETGEEDASKRAGDLVVGALRSAGEALRTQAGNLDAAVDAAQSRLASEIAEGSAALLDRVGAGRMEARLFAARSHFTNLRAWVNDRWGPPVERTWRSVAVRLARLRRFGRRAVRKGSAIVGSAPTETAASTRTLRALANPGAATEGLPLVYQRLFTLDPIEDPTLMSGRDVELTEGMRRWRRWHDTDGVPLIVQGRQGSGVTSFLNVLGARIEEDDGAVVRTSLQERVTSEKALSEHLASTLGLEPVASLDALATAIFDAARDSLPAAAVLDDLEHLYLRVPRGTDLIERLLTLMAETEPRVFWIGGITASAWQMVSTAEPTAISQVDVFDLQPLTAQQMRAAVSVRHRRSGLAIRYQEPTTGRHLLRRRLRRMRNAEGYRELLEEDFFDRLHRASGGHLGLALHQWLVSADFASGEGVLMRQPERPDFAVLEALDLTQNFTLKAFLEHRSLSLEEHDRVFRMPRQESYQVLESLRNRHLLEPLDRDEEEAAEPRSEIDDELRYRIHPLLTGAVIAHLRSLNIVH